MFFNGINKGINSYCFNKTILAYKCLDSGSKRLLLTQSLYHSDVTQLQLDSNVSSLSTLNNDTSSASEVIKNFQVLRTKPKEYDDIEHLRNLSRKTLENLPLFKSDELANMCEIFSALKYRNILVMHGITESFYWMCKMKRVKLRDLSRFLKNCAILRYIPNLRYLDVFFKELDDIHHLKTVGDYLRFLNFLVDSDLWVHEKYIRLYLKLYDHCKTHMGLMNHSHLSSFSQIQLKIDDSDQQVTDKICLNFERDLEKCEVSHLKMLINSMLRSNLVHLPNSISRVIKYWSNNKRELLTPDLTIDVLSLFSKFYQRDTEILNKLGLAISQRLGEYSLSQLSTGLNHFASLSYKHKSLILSVSQINLDIINEDYFSKLKLISSLSNLICKVKYNHIDSINSISTKSILSINHLTKTTDFNTMGLYVKEVGKIMDSCKSIITTDDFVENDGMDNVAGFNRSNVRRLVKTKLNTEDEVFEGKLRYLPESTDVIKVQSLAECINRFLEKYFSGRHPALKRLENRKLMKLQVEKFKNKPNYNSSNSLSNVFHEIIYKSRYNTSVRRIKYKMKYSGSRIVQPTTFYINHLKILKRAFLSPYLVGNKQFISDSMINKQSPYYVDKKIVLYPKGQISRLKYKTKVQLNFEIRSTKKVDSVINYLTSNNFWSYSRPKITSQITSILTYISPILNSLFKLNFLSYQLVKSISNTFLDNCIESIVKYNCTGSVTLSNIFNSINKLLTSLKPTFVNDRSRTVLDSITQTLCSKNFNRLFQCCSSGMCEDDVCKELLHNLCIISFLNYTTNVNYLNSKTGSNSIEWMMNEICLKKNSINLYNKGSVQYLNDLIYTCWISSLLNLNDEIGNEAQSLALSHIVNVINCLRDEKFEFKAVKDYLSLIRRYISLLRIKRERLKLNTDIGLEFDEGCIEGVERDWRNLMEKYRISENMTEGVKGIEFDFRRCLIKGDNVRNFPESCDLPLNFPGSTLLCDFYLEYYCNF